tara:strand:+ start:1062 stop:2072 length:1011 start_codon:yes stop_codon:yes gene_type:complete
MKTRYKHGGKNKKQEYGVGGAIMTLGKNLLQGKKLGSGALKGVLRAGITPGSGVGAGIGLAGALAGRSKNPNMQNLGQGLGMAGNLANMFTGGQGGGMSALMDRFRAEEGMKMPYAYGGKMKVMKKGGLVGGQKKLDKNNDGKITGEDFKMLRSMMGGGKMEYMDGGKMYEDGGKLDVNDLLESLEVKNPELMSKAVELVKSDDKRGLNKLLNQAYREDVRNMEMYGDPEADAEHFEKDAARDNKIFKRNTLSIKRGVEGNPELGFRGKGIRVKRDVNKLLDNLEDPQGTRDRQQILKQLALMLATAGAGSLVGARSNSMRTSPWAQLFPGIFDNQ